MTSEVSDEETGSYTSRVGAVYKWAVAALAAVGTAAVTKLSLDRFGNGDLERKNIVWAYVGLACFTAGVIFIIACVIWNARASRVTLGYLTDGKTPIARSLRSFFNRNYYFLGNQRNLASFRTRFSELAQKRPNQTPAEQTEWRQLKGSRDDILKTGAAERTRIVSLVATPVMVLGALMATLGAATFALATNHDVIQREDRLAKEKLERTDQLARAERGRKDVVTGTLLPKTPTPVSVVVPTKARRGPTDWDAVVGKACKLRGINAVLLEVAAPPSDAVPKRKPSHVFHVATERSSSCEVVNLWVPAAWVIPREAKTGDSA